MGFVQVENRNCQDFKYISQFLMYLMHSQNKVLFQLFSKDLKVIPEFCMAYSYCARVLRHQRAYKT